MRNWLKFERTTIAWSIASIGLTWIALWLSRGTDYDQPAIGFFASAVALSVSLLVFEALWWIACQLMGFEVESDEPPATSGRLMRKPEPPRRR